MKIYWFLRHLFIYAGSSFLYLLLKGKGYSFVYDLKRFPKWYQYKVSTDDFLKHEIPWMCFGVVDYLGQWLTKKMLVFEYGSGGSTLYLSKRVKRLHSVEYDLNWYNHVNSILSLATIDGITYQFILPEKVEATEQEKCGKPEAYLSCMGAYKGLRFQQFVQSIESYPTDYFDLVIVDGRARPSCIQHAIPKIKQGGILLVDNADRAYYLKPFPELSDHSKWEEKSFTGHTPFGLTSVLYTTKLFIKK
ncbi:MAG: hypothetical protein GXC73_14660 [Chitinophagaceae bacterium]|nr:hypothetical protein [Chitinophagaceae bacterium]